MANGFKPFELDGIVPETIDRDGNPLQEKGPEFRIFTEEGKAVTNEEYAADRKAQGRGLIGDIAGAPNADEFDFRVTSYMDPYEVRARRQTTASKWGNASVKMLGLAGTTAIDGTLGTVIGLGNGIASMVNGGRAS